MSTSVDSTARTAWWMLLVRAVLTLVFGIVALASPGIALLVLVYVFASYALLEGVAAISFGIRARGTPHRGWSVAQGVISVLAGLVTLIWPGQTALTLLFLVAFWAIVLGVAEVGEAFAARRRGEGSWGWTLAAGVLNVVVGVVLLVRPGSGILTLLWLIGAFAVAAGIAGIGWAFRTRAATGPADPVAEDRA
jgi:uncharacterized membrane protein HdeD (DUF308 family)